MTWRSAWSVINASHIQLIFLSIKAPLSGSRQVREEGVEPSTLSMSY